MVSPHPVASRKLRFLFLAADKYPPFRVDVATLFGKELSAHGHVIDWILTSEKPCDIAFQANWEGGKVWVGANVGDSTPINWFKSRLLAFRNDLRLFSLLRATRYDFIQVKDKFIAPLLAIVASRFFRIPFFYWLSFPYPEAARDFASQKKGLSRIYHLGQAKFFGFLLYRIILPRASHIFVQSDQMKKDLESMGVPGIKMSPVPMGISISSMPKKAESKMRSTLGQGEKVVYLGTLSAIRRMDFLIRVMAEVLKAVPSAHLFLVGAGNQAEDERTLRLEAKRLRIDDKLTITGFLPMHQAWDYVRCADVCVSPFFPTPVLNSTSPTKLVEYLALGKAVVANDHPDQSKVLGESGGGICVPYQEDAFAGGIIELLQNPEKALEMGRKGREYVALHRDYERIGEYLESEYFRILATTKPSGPISPGA
jgi:glycosyltransferase involved in cell wall biosynthesis